MSLLTDHWLHSLEAISAPDESLKYDESYVNLKNQMSQVTFDAVAMIKLASSLLQRSKDWQLCHFLLLSCSAAGYLDDFIVAMKAYEFILSKGVSVYPQSSQGRQAALYWLNQSPIIELIQQQKGGITPDWINQCTSLWKSLQNFWKLHFEADHLSWHTMGTWLAQYQPDPKKIEDTIAPPLLSSINFNQTIEDDHQAAERLNELWEYYLKRGHKLKAMCLSRCAAWGHFVMPKSESGKTFIDPIRPLDHQKLNALYLSGQWEMLWDDSERCFQQKGGPFDVRLQYFVIQAIEQLNLEDELNWAKSFFINRMKTFTQWSEMFFIDGSPFCDDSVRAWAHSLKIPENHALEQKNTSSFELTEQSIKLREREAQLWLDAFIPQSHLDMAWYRYLWVLHDHTSNKSDHALRGYEILIQFCNEKSLYHWNSELMKKIWKLGVEMSGRKGVRYDQLISQIIQHDVKFAGELQ